jgi:hypothetical protein
MKSIFFVIALLCARVGSVRSGGKVKETAGAAAKSFLELMKH